VADPNGEKVAIRLSGFVGPDHKFSRPGKNTAARGAEGIMMFDVKTKAVLFTYLSDTGSFTGNGEAGFSFSSNGKYMFLLAHRPDNKEETSIILDANSGRQVGTFPSSAAWGLAVSPDGKTMAVGHDKYIDLFDLK
jgi:WD40 repeat protein